jgi:hypothetical protein
VYESFAAPFTAAIEEGIAEGIFSPRSPVPDVVDRLVSQIDGFAVRTLLGVLDETRMLALLVDLLCLELGLSEQDAAAARAHATTERDWDALLG